MTTSRNGDPSPRSIVAFGGGTGMQSLLTGLKELTPNVTCIVAVTDDGGSSGILRSDLDIPPPGDIRNCLLALSEADPLLKEALAWRFTAGELNGHSVGNLLIAATTLIRGDLGTAVRDLHRILQVRGRVIPSTTRKVSLVAHHDDGSSTTGEVRISRAERPISRLELRPDPGPLSEEALAAIAAADCFVFGPGSLFTSIITNLLVPGMVDAIRRAGRPRLFVANIMTQPSETSGFSLADHVEALEEHAGRGFLDAIIASGTPIPDDVAERYRGEGAQPVLIDRERIKDIPVFVDDLAEGDRVIRHDPERLARKLLEVFTWISR
jgi:uncharacterized cofD-like protein